MIAHGLSHLYPMYHPRFNRILVRVRLVHRIQIAKCSTCMGYLSKLYFFFLTFFLIFFRLHLIRDRIQIFGLFAPDCRVSLHSRLPCVFRFVVTSTSDNSSA